MENTSALESKCREAFKKESGYTVLPTNSSTYRAFRDGFYAAYGVFVVDPLCKKESAP